MLVIFDCDGVLVDSESLAAKVFSEVLLRFGIQLDSNSCYKNFQGKTLAYCYTWIEKSFALTLPPSFHAELVNETEKQFSLYLQPVAGVEEVVQYLLSHNIKICVASNGSHKKIVSSLSKVGLLNYFPQRFSVEDVSEGKPSPELFLYAAEKMSVAEKYTIVIEDSQAGMEAALAANMNVIMYQSDSSQRPEVCPSMSDVLDQIKKCIAQFS